MVDFSTFGVIVPKRRWFLFEKRLAALSLVGWGGLSLSLFLGYLLLIALVEPGQHLRTVDVIDFVSIFNADDSLRFFIAKQAFSNVELYSWNYYLPASIFLDGLLVTLLGGDISTIRAVKLVVAITANGFIYLSLQHLRVSNSLSKASVLIILMMPVFMFVVMSFLGESWLAAFISAAIFFFLRGNLSLVAALVSAFPLIRPEGFFFIPPLALYFLLHRRWDCFFLLILPGFAYFLWLVYSLDGFLYYFQWRVEYRRYTNHIHFHFLYGIKNFFVSYNAIWLAISMLGCCLLWSRLWPFLIGSVLLAAWFLLAIYKQASFYEPRYFVPIIPILAIGFGVGADSILKKIRLRGRVHFLALFALVVFVLVNHILQIDELRKNYTGGKRLPLNSYVDIYSGSRGYDTESVESIRAVLPVLYDVVERDGRHIEALFLPMQEDIFYFLDPAKIKGLDVAMLPIAYGGFVGIFGGSIYGMYPGGRQYSFYNFYDNNLEGAARLGLYLGDLSSCAVCQPLVVSGNLGLYPVYFVESDEPMIRPSEDNIFIISPRQI